MTSSSEPGPLRLHVAGGVAEITLAMPKRMNSLGSDALHGLMRLLDELAQDRTIGCVLIAGEGKHFCTGAALDEVLPALQAPGAIEEFLATGCRCFNAIERLPLPVVAAVHGTCLAGGLELVLACDLVVAARSAKFGDQHANFGLVPGWDGGRRLVATVGTRRARELMYSGSGIDSAQAQDWGLVNWVADDDDLMPRAREICRQLAGRSRTGLATMKALSAQAPADSAAAIELAAAALRSTDAAEGIRAFLERRPPVFNR